MEAQTPTLAAPLTLLHVTHWKAGSQWIRRILEAASPAPVVQPQLPDVRLDEPLRAGCVYPCLYITREEFAALRLPPDYYYFVVIRDLRDTLVSLYFSLLASHMILSDDMQGWRTRLQGLDRRAGLRALMEVEPGEGIELIARIQDSWVGAPCLLRFEDLLRRDVMLLDRSVRRNARWPLDRAHFTRVVMAHRFERLTGRQPGDEDVTSHERKGVAGDWRNYFDSDLKDAFKQRFGQTLIRTGYEADLAW
jgi:lipopolysaccharide transport system ATP-binding protein